MRDKLAPIVALAGFAAVTVLGSGIAGASQSSGIAESHSASPLPGTALAPSVQSTACANEADDDGDGALDLADPDCESAADPVEAPATEPADPTAGGVPEPSGGEGVQSGASLDAEDVRAAGGVERNQGLAASRAGQTSAGAVVAPPATAGDQPAPGPDGGSQFDDGGTPTAASPSTTVAPFGPAPIGVPNFVIDSFEIPPFLLPIYQACGTEYGIPWQVLASINKIETGFGTNLNVSSAGALGWMQFLPSSWEMYGVDANGDGRKDPYNPVDAICAAARYLKAAGGREDLYGAIFAYNHADWYVEEVLLYARAYGKLPSDLVGSLTGLTEGAHFPVAADARYAGMSSSPTRRGIDVFARAGAPVVAVNDGIVVKLGESERLGRFVVLRDAYGNRYTYAKLGRLVTKRRLIVMPTGREKRIPVDSQNIRARLHALPERVDERQRLSAQERVDDARALGADGSIRVGSKVIAGTVLGRIGVDGGGVEPHVNFSIRPAGRGAPRIDPKPILDGWKLLEATAIYRAKGKSPFAAKLGSAGVLLLSKEALQRRVLANRAIELPDCDRIEVRAGQIDRRVLAALAYLAKQGFRMTITSMLCGRYGSITTSGNVSNHSFGGAVDIATINGVPVLGHQGPGTLTHELLEAVLQLQGTMAPDELISLENLGGPSFAMSDHADHVHIGWRPTYGTRIESEFVQLLKPDQWLRLTDRLEKIDNPEVPTAPSKYSLP